MKKKKILFLYSFNTLQTLPSSYGKILHDLNKKFKNFYIVNTDNLEIIFKSKIKNLKKTDFFKNIKLFNPKNLKEQQLWITRKGATSAKLGEYGIIPGSKGVGSFIVRGLGNPQSWESCSHGAGR